MSLRKANMGDLLLKHSEATTRLPNVAAPDTVAPTVSFGTTKSAAPSKSVPLPPAPPTTSTQLPSNVRLAPSASGSTRRVSSDDIYVASDKENDDIPTQPAGTMPPLKNPKRAKAGGPTSRATSRTAKPTSVLSPKSHNSRTLPRSPIKEYPSPTKPHSYMARPTSPLKPASPLKTAASAATSAISASLHGMVEHAKRGAGATARGLAQTASKEKVASSKTTKPMAPPPRPPLQPHLQQEPARTVSSASSHSNSSNASASSTSTNTTVVKKSGKAVTTMSQTTTEKKGAAATKTVTKKTTTAMAAKKPVVAEPATGRRILRKRN